MSFTSIDHLADRMESHIEYNNNHYAHPYNWTYSGRVLVEQEGKAEMPLGARPIRSRTTRQVGRYRKATAVPYNQIRVAARQADASLFKCGKLKISGPSKTFGL